MCIRDRPICDQSAIKVLEELLVPYPNKSPSVEQIWQIMDEVWDRLGCDNKNLNWDNISAFYNHPVWILNGLFIEQHELSMQHRQAIADWIDLNNTQIQKVVDYGGGMGTIPKLIAATNSNVQIDIYEPYPSQFAIKRLEEYPSIGFVDKLPASKYDCLISTDVLEHVVDPLAVFEEMIKAVRQGGYLLIANNFEPVIKCHLPQTFHFRPTFKFFAKFMGLKHLNLCEDSHATIYLKESDQPINWSQLRKLEALSKSVYPLLDILQKGYRSLNKSKS